MIDSVDALFMFCSFWQSIPVSKQPIESHYSRLAVFLSTSTTSFIKPLSFHEMCSGLLRSVKSFKCKIIKISVMYTIRQTDAGNILLRTNALPVNPTTAESIIFVQFIIR